MEPPLKPVYHYDLQDPSSSDPINLTARRAADREKIQRQNLEARRRALSERSALENELEGRQRRTNACKSAAKVVAKVIATGLLTVCYSFLGTYIFIQLERSNEKEMCLSVERLYTGAETAEALSMWKVSQSYLAADEDGQLEAVGILRKRLRQFRDDVVIELDYDGKNCSALGEPGGPEYSWSTMNSLLFSVTVITTVGYGNVAPKTVWGRMTVIIYSLVGLPIVFVSLTIIGEIMASVFRFTYSKICCLEACKKRKVKPRGKNHPTVTVNDKCHPSLSTTIIDEEDDDDNEEDEEDEDEEIPVPVTVTLLVIASYILLGTIMFSNWEDWDYLKSAYYCFITLATIGFGDVLPGIFSDSDSGLKMAVASLYIFLGLALMAMGFDLIQYEMAKRLVSLGGHNAAKAGDTVDEMTGKSEDDVQSDVMTQRVYRSPPTPSIRNGFNPGVPGHKHGEEKEKISEPMNIMNQTKNVAKPLPDSAPVKVMPAVNVVEKEPHQDQPTQIRPQYITEVTGQEVKKRVNRSDPSTADGLSKKSDPPGLKDMKRGERIELLPGKDEKSNEAKKEDKGKEKDSSDGTNKSVNDSEETDGKAKPSRNDGKNQANENEKSKKDDQGVGKRTDADRTRENKNDNRSMPNEADNKISSNIQNNSSDLKTGEPKTAFNSGSNTASNESQTRGKGKEMERLGEAGRKSTGISGLDEDETGSKAITPV